MAEWYLAPSLVVLRDEINRRWPGRDRASDGSIGDRAHQLTKSDHNPNSRGSVNAVDVDEDGIDFPAVFAAIRRHPSARYVIYERELYHRDRGWRAETYTGPNPHDKHFHLSIDQTVAAEQDRRPWGITEDDMADSDKILALVERIDRRGPVWHQQDEGSAERADGSTYGFRQVRDELAELRAAVAGATPLDYDELAAALLRQIARAGT